MHVLAFHGAGASPERLARDMGNPPWVTCCPNYKRKSPERFAEEFRYRHGRDKVVLAGYSDGGDFVCRLTHTELAENIAGIIVYESPARALPRVLPVPVVMIWNDYDPIEKYVRFIGRRRQAIKDASIDAWSRYESVRAWTGNIDAHIYWASSWPFLRHAWDQSLNARLAKFIGSLNRRESAMQKPTSNAPFKVYEIDGGEFWNIARTPEESSEISLELCGVGEAGVELSAERLAELRYSDEPHTSGVSFLEELGCRYLRGSLAPGVFAERID